MKKIIALFLVVALLLSMGACSEDDNVEDIARAYIKAIIEKDRSTLKTFMYPRYFEECAVEMLEDHSNGLKVSSFGRTVVFQIDKEEYEERMADSFDICVEVEAACIVFVQLKVLENNGEVCDDFEQMGATMVKIDGRWYGLEPEW